ncbi:MAG: hypothetical protein CMK32_11365 [Porticoccaceae bacterium]|nr:hypothetical protein [Porticoccaceae bacterium]
MNQVLVPPEAYTDTDSLRRLSQIRYQRIRDIDHCIDLSKDRRDTTRRGYWFIEQGGGFAVVNHEEFKLCPGTVMTIPANAMYRFHLLPGTDGMVFCGSELFMRSRVATGLYTTASSYQEGYYKPSAYYRYGGDAQEKKRLQLFREIAAAATRLGMGCDAAVMGYIFVLLADGALPEELGNDDLDIRTSSEYTDLVYEFQMLVEKHYRDHISIDCYCKMLAVSRVKLIDACRYLLDKTPLEILHARLLVEAKRQLLTTTKRVSEVAYTLGFEDSAYFSRFFKNQTHESPRDFRRAHSQTD